MYLNERRRVKKWVCRPGNLDWGRSDQTCPDKDGEQLETASGLRGETDTWKEMQDPDKRYSTERAREGLRRST